MYLLVLWLLLFLIKPMLFAQFVYFHKNWSDLQIPPSIPSPNSHAPAVPILNSSFRFYFVFHRKDHRHQLCLALFKGHRFKKIKTNVTQTVILYQRKSMVCRTFAKNRTCNVQSHVEITGAWRKNRSQMTRDNSSGNKIILHKWLIKNTVSTTFVSTPGNKIILHEMINQRHCVDHSLTHSLTHTTTTQTDECDYDVKLVRQIDATSCLPARQMSLAEQKKQPWIRIVSISGTRHRTGVQTIPSWPDSNDWSQE